MKAKINNIEFEGTPEEFAEFLRLQTEKVECSEKTEDNTDVLRRAAKGGPGRGRHQDAALISVLYKGQPVGTMNLTDFASLLGRRRETVRNWFVQKDRIEYEGYTATMIKRGKPRMAIRVKATDTKGNNRIYPSCSDFCAKTNTAHTSFAWLRLKQPKGPWKINGYTVEQIN